MLQIKKGTANVWKYKVDNNANNTNDLHFRKLQIVNISMATLQKNEASYL